MGEFSTTQYNNNFRGSGKCILARPLSPSMPVK